MGADGQDGAQEFHVPVHIQHQIHHRAHDVQETRFRQLKAQSRAIFTGGHVHTTGRRHRAADDYFLTCAQLDLGVLPNYGDRLAGEFQPAADAAADSHAPRCRDENAGHVGPGEVTEGLYLSSNFVDVIIVSLNIDCRVLPEEGYYTPHLHTIGRVNNQTAVGQKDLHRGEFADRNGENIGILDVRRGDGDLGLGCQLTADDDLVFGVQ